MDSSLRTRSPALFTSRRDDWATPRALRAQIYDLFGPITLDAAASPKTTLVRSNWFGPAQKYPDRRDALALEWNEPQWHRRLQSKLVYLNPPYGRALPLWVDKAISCSRAGVPVLLLVPARTDTRWGQRLLHEASSVIFLKGRLSFDNVGRAPFPSMVVCLATKTHCLSPKNSTSLGKLGTSMCSS
jgi:phage N-6-adenine-methyltransferase